MMKWDGYQKSFYHLGKKLFIKCAIEKVQYEKVQYEKIQYERHNMATLIDRQLDAGFHNTVKNILKVSIADSDIEKIDIPNIICKKCQKKFKGVESSSGKPFYNNFNIRTKTCMLCDKIHKISQNKLQYLRKAGVLTKYLNSTLDNFIIDKYNKNVFEFCKKYALSNNPKIGIFLHGPSGIGKTHIATAVLREMLLKGHSCFFTSTPDLLYNVRKTFSENVQTTDEEVLRQYLGYQFLVLDDFGVEKSSEWVRQTLDHIVYHRDAAVMPLIITSNLNLQDIGKQLDTRISSRIKGMCCVLGMTGRDRRNVNGDV